MKFYTSILLALVFVGSLNAQVVDKAEDKAKRKTNQRIDKKIDNSIDDGLDAIEGLFKRKKKKGKTDENEVKERSPKSEEPEMSGFMNMMGNKTIDKTFDFDQRITLETISIDEKGNSQDPYTSVVYLSDDHRSIGMNVSAGMEGAESVDMMVFDFDENQMLMMMTNNGQKMGFVMDTDGMADAAMNSDNSDAKIIKTGKTKEISGYSCEEYIFESSDFDEGEVQSAWITQEAEVNWIEAWSEAMSANKKAEMKQKLPENYPDGAVIQTVYQEKSGKKHVMTVTDIDTNHSKSVNTSGYNFMSMPAGQSMPTGN
ncbi:MAG TPA: DUF4412 domain-containing protein [Cryomorphaceae bacterium]|nr:DUF4412 domain-containing protein [Cryomorphaceae bacterium]